MFLTRIQWLLALASPWIIHQSVVQQRLELAIYYLLLIIILFLIKNLKWWPRVLPLALLVLVAGITKNTLPLYVLPILIVGGIFFLFAYTLLPGQTPLIYKMHRAVYQDETEVGKRYTRKLTWIWTILLGLLLLSNLSLTFFASIETWSLFANFINYIAMLTLFFGEIILRPILLPGFPSKQMLTHANKLKALFNFNALK